LTHGSPTQHINSAPVSRKSPLLAFALFAVLIVAPSAHAVAEDGAPASCADDAVLVFDASGSMMSSDKDVDGLKRIDRVREAMRKVLPTVAFKKRLGLVTYGPGSTNKCENIKVEFTPRLDAAERILEVVEALRPDGRTPLTRAVRTAADILDYRKRPAVIVLLTDGEETCGGATCALAKSLKAQAAAITVHVVSYRIKESLGPDGIFEARCLADETGGLYISTETTDELIAALEKTLGCPLVTDAR
jgi:Ca-activated chloride channel family protein